MGFKPPCSTWLGLGSVRVRVRGRSKPQQDLVGFELALLHPLRRVVDVACLVLQHLGKDEGDLEVTAAVRGRPLTTHHSLPTTHVHSTTLLVLQHLGRRSIALRVGDAAPLPLTRLVRG